MNKLVNRTAVLICAFNLISTAVAEDKESFQPYSEQPFSLAVFGDSPYGCKQGECTQGFSPDSANGVNPGDPRQLESTPAFINAINSDPKIHLVMHVGDIHSGSQFCTLTYNQRVFDLWKNFKDPLIYTPGDNEWADCQKSKEGGNVQDGSKNYVDYANGNPVANLALIRSMFFPKSGETLGQHKKQVISQNKTFDPNHPTDAEYIENLMWEQSGVLFLTLNIPGGSNNDDDIWFGAAAQSGEQKQEVSQRTAANLRWLDAAFLKAKTDHMTAVVIAEQADMWDLDGKSSSHIANYKPFIDKIYANTVDFNKPVLLLNGDSHTYRSDNPLTDNAPCFIEASSNSEAACSDDSYDNQPHGYTASNFHRIVVHGAYTPLEYLRLNINPHANYASSDTTFGPFSWERIVP